MKKLLIAALLVAGTISAAQPAEAGVCRIKRGVYVCIPLPTPPWFSPH